jgi:predicted nuclease of predicted toxin-antitoxin system
VTRLFVAVYLDEDVPVLVADLLRTQQYEAMTTVEAGRRGKSDAEQLAFAAEHGYALLTHNRLDFEGLARDYLATGRTHAGIIIAVRRPAYELVRRLDAILDEFTADEFRDQLRYI